MDVKRVCGHGPGLPVLANNVFIAQAYKFFATTVKVQAKETWNSVLNNLTVVLAGQQNVAAWQGQQATFLI